MTNLPRLLIATGNPGKAAEFALLLAGSGWQPVTPADLGLAPVDIVETGRSYLENAVTKAVRHSEASGLPALGDDSGLEVDALEGRPGVLSARYGGSRAPGATERNALLLDELRGVPPGRRGARFRAVVALALPGGRMWVREGAVEGRIAEAPARRRRLRLRPAVRAARRPHDGRAGRGKARLQPSRPRRARPLPAAAAPERVALDRERLSA